MARFLRNGDGIHIWGIQAGWHMHASLRRALTDCCDQFCRAVFTLGR